MGMETIGKIFAIFDSKQISERFRKREFVLELTDNPKYPQLVLFQATGDRCEQLDSFSDGDEVRVEFSLRGREWRSPKGETKYFNTLDIWKIERVGSKQTQRSSLSSSSATPPATPPPTDLPPPMADDDIPF